MEEQEMLGNGASSSDRIICTHYYGWVITGQEHLIGGHPNASCLEEWLRGAFQNCLESCGQSLQEMGMPLALFGEIEMWFYETHIGDRVRSVDLVVMLVIK